MPINRLSLHITGLESGLDYGACAFNAPFAMRLWSIHPKHLDRQGLIALWREGLLAQKVLAGKTRGYRHHPQLIRFYETRNPVEWIGAYLVSVASEAEKRSYHFDRSKILKPNAKYLRKIAVSNGQLRYEVDHLKRKLSQRDLSCLKRLKSSPRIFPHPLFHVVPGKVHFWEKQTKRERSR